MEYWREIKLYKLNYIKHRHMQKLTRSASDDSRHPSLDLWRVKSSSFYLFLISLFSRIHFHYPTPNTMQKQPTTERKKNQKKKLIDNIPLIDSRDLSYHEKRL